MNVIPTKSASKGKISEIKLTTILTIMFIMIVLVKCNHSCSKTEDSESPSRDSTVFTNPSITGNGTSIGYRSNEQDAVVRQEEQSAPTTHPNLIGLTFEGKAKQSSFKISPKQEKDYWWYTSNGKEDMVALDVIGIKGIILRCHGPVIYEVTTRKPGEKAVAERFKKEYGNPTHLSKWNDLKMEWETPIPFDIVEYTKGILLEIRVLKDKEDLTPIKIEVGIPIPTS